MVGTRSKAQPEQDERIDTILSRSEKILNLVSWVASTFTLKTQNQMKLGKSHRGIITQTAQPR